MAGGTALLRRRPLVLGALAVVVALAIAITLTVTKPWAATKTRDDVAAPGAGDRVLQSVDVTMQGGGALTRVGDTVVIARAQGGRADTYTTAYDPTKVVDQLPVRVLTAYRTDQGSGTDLGDLKGYTGRVSLDVTVQNLTVAPQEVTYDVAGRSQTRTALVGAPLTVVASAALPGVDPATVVTAAADAPAGGLADATNGVLSQGADGATQVQWASILAPPQLGATATFRAVLDAKDFQVPTIDLSVQPGLVTDPSVGALIDSAFNPKNSSELALETRTIKLVGDVNDVLGRASGTITGVRKTLDASSKTLGTKTVRSLTEDTKTISSSLKSSSDSIDSLGDDLRSSLQTTQSATLQRMSETVSGLQDLIGDTSVAEPTATVTGTGCAATVTAPSSGGGVYASLLAVSAQLDAYARTTEGCKAELQGSIRSTIGTVDTAGKPACDDKQDSVVCELAAAQEQFAGAVQAVTTAVDQGQQAALELDPATVGTSARQLQELSGRLGALVDGLMGDEATTDGGKALQKGVSVVELTDVEKTLAGISDDLDATATSLDKTDAGLGEVADGLADINGRAQSNAKEIGTRDEDGKIQQPGSMLQQNDDLAQELCKLRNDATPAGPLPPAEVERLRSYLVTGTCPDLPAPVVAPLPTGYTAMATRLGRQQSEWSTIEASTDAEPKAGTTTLATRVAGARDDLAAVSTQLGDAQRQLGSTGQDLTDTRKTLEKVLDEINQARKQADEDAEDLSSLSDDVAGLKARYTTAQSALVVALGAARTAASTAEAANLDEQIKQVAAQGQRSSQDLDKAFAASAGGISAAADALHDGAASTLRRQQQDLANQGRADQADLSDQTRSGLRQISGSVTSATRDIDATRTTLGQDLNNVLIDLGNRDKPGQGLLGTLDKSARSADSADFQLGGASDTVSSYSSVRSQEVDGILLRQAQAEAALQRQAALPAFATEIPANVQHRTVYLFHVGAER